MGLVNEIISSIKSKKMTLEEKIEYIEKIKKNGVDIKNIKKDYISPDGIRAYNVILNIKKYYKHNLMPMKQVLECELLGIDFETTNNDINNKIEYLNKAKEEIDFVEIINNYDKYKETTIYRYISELRDEYEYDTLTSEQIEKCVNNLNIIITKETRKDILIDKIKKCAFENILSIEQINKIIKT